MLPKYRYKNGLGSNAPLSREMEIEALLQPAGQGRKGRAWDQEGGEVEQVLEDAFLVHRLLEVIVAAAAPGADFAAQHALRHQGVAAAPGGEKFVDIHQMAEQPEREV